VNLLWVEMRRALHRRLVWVLIAVALVGCVILGIVAFVDSAGKTVAELRASGEHPATMAAWWVAGGGDGTLMIAAFPLFLGGLIGGASVAGAEWKMGTVTTVLTWEPRRVRLQLARVASAFLLAAAIGFILQGMFLLSAVPAVATHGSTAGVDAGWWWSLVAAMARISLITAGAAALGASLATIGRNTSFGLVAGFGWMAIGENLVRAYKPGLSQLLLGENIAIALTWAPLEGVEFTRSEVEAAGTLVLYAALIVGAATWSFKRRDIAGTS
jgi:hypothetical protein